MKMNFGVSRGGQLRQLAAASQRFSTLLYNFWNLSLQNKLSTFSLPFPPPLSSVSIVPPRPPSSPRILSQSLLPFTPPSSGSPAGLSKSLFSLLSPSSFHSIPSVPILPSLYSQFTHSLLIYLSSDTVWAMQSLLQPLSHGSLQSVSRYLPLSISFLIPLPVPPLVPLIPYPIPLKVLP